jgi:hypothetical protein
MKKIVVALAIAAVAATASVSIAAIGAGTGVNGSLHDMNHTTPGYTGDSLGRSCVFCHTPHNAFNNVGDAPLWNHAMSTATVAMQPYTWIAPANLLGSDPVLTPTHSFEFAPDPLIGPSRLCMACHDGVTAVDSHGSAASETPSTQVMTSNYDDILGHNNKRYISDLTVTHPIGFSYVEAAANRGPLEIVPATGTFITADVSLATFDTHARGTDTTGKKISEVLYSGRMTCASCHDVHNTNNAVPTGTHNYNYFLWAKEEGSAICLSCHVK